MSESLCSTAAVTTTVRRHWPMKFCALSMVLCSGDAGLGRKFPCSSLILFALCILVLLVYAFLLSKLQGTRCGRSSLNPRKGDEFCLSHTTELTVKSSKVAAHCTRYHDVAMVIFSLTGYTGNLFHDFTDVIVPLFTMASQFNGEVQFLITDMALWWTIKYHTLLQKLSKYPLINFSKDDKVHCFKHAIVGTHAYMEFTIDASKSPHDVTMVDFNRFMRAAYSLPNETAVASARGEPQGQAQAAHHEEAPHQDVPQPGGDHRHGRGALINSGAI
ncbi:hypothetical protein ZWY2020_000267 [Hordeum vulgare]|nr:hypothetical protein ZWY2020_000267 [Hordeum vulgare]